MKRPTVRPNPHATAFRAADLGIRNVFRLRLAPVGEIVKSAPIADVDVTGNVANGMTVDAGDRVALGGPKDARLCAHGGLSALGNSGRLNAARCPGRASKFLSSLEVDGAL